MNRRATRGAALLVAVALLLCVRLAAAAGAATALELSGRAYSYLRMPLALGGPVQQASTSLRIDAHARMTNETFAAVSGVVDALHPDVAGDSEIRGRLREAYVGAHAGGFEVRAGQQILSWGNADGVHAVDLLGAQDFAFQSATVDAQKLGAPNMLLSFKPDEGTSPLEVTVVWQPVMPASRVLIPSGAIPPQVRLLAEERPRAVFESEGAIKIAWAPGGWDVALVGFHGFNHLSEPYLARIAGGVAEVGRRFQSYDAAGLHASVALDEWVLRLEGAYVVTANDSGKDRLRQPSHLDAIVGAERPLGERVRASVQGVVRHHPMFLPLDAPYAGSVEVAEATRQIAQVNARVQNYTHQTRPGASVALAYASEDESFEASFAALAYVIGFDWVVQPTLAYRPLEHLKLEVGAQIFGGQRSSLGFLSSQSGLFAQATFTL